MTVKDFEDIRSQVVANTELIKALRNHVTEVEKKSVITYMINSQYVISEALSQATDKIKILISLTDSVAGYEAFQDSEKFKEVLNHVINAFKQ